MKKIIPIILSLISFMAYGEVYKNPFGKVIATENTFSYLDVNGNKIEIEKKDSWLRINYANNSIDVFQRMDGVLIIKYDSNGTPITQNYIPNDQISEFNPSIKYENEQVYLNFKKYLEYNEENNIYIFGWGWDCGLDLAVFYSTTFAAAYTCVGSVGIMCAAGVVGVVKTFDSAVKTCTK